MAKIRKSQPPLFDYSKINQYIPWYMDYLNSTNSTKPMNPMNNQYQNPMDYWDTMTQPQNQQNLWNEQQRINLMNQEKYFNELNQYIQQGNVESGTTSPRRKGEAGFVSMYYKQPKNVNSSPYGESRLVNKRKKPRQR